MCFTLRCNKKLQRLLDVDRPGKLSMGVPTTRLGDWYANIVYRERQPYVLVTSERTLLPVVVSAAPIDSLMPRFFDALIELLISLGVQETIVDEEPCSSSSSRER